MRDIFQKIYDENYWRNNESVSGHGSTLAATETVRQELPRLFKRYEIQTLFDIPCGDFHWMRQLIFNDMRYLGADIIPEIISKNQTLYARDNRLFAVMDITRDPLPAADLILCRDLLGHFSNADVLKALVNIKHSKAKYLLATTFPDHENTGDIHTGQWRPINLASMWGLPNPIEVINEQCKIPGFEDKSLGLWDLREVR